MRGTWPSLVAIAVIGVSACGRGGDDARRTEGTSLGQLDSLPIVAIGGDEANPLYRVAGAVLAGHQFIVANAGTHALHYYDLDGRLVRVVGRQGEGPGEFQQILWMQALRDGVAAFDRELGRLSVFSATGEFVRAVRLVVPSQYALAEPLGVFSDGSILAHAWPMVRETASAVYRDTLAILRYDSLGQRHDSLGSYRWDEGYREVSAQGGFMSRLPFGRRGIVAVHGRHYYVMENDDFGIAVLDPTGTMIRELRPPSEPPPLRVTEADVEKARTRFDSPEVPPQLRTALLERFDRMPLPPTFPPYGWLGTRPLTVLRVSDDGSVWALQFGGVREGRPVWAVYGSDGSLRSHVSAEREVDLLAVRNDTAVVRRWAEGDVEWIELRRIRR